MRARIAALLFGAAALSAPPPLAAVSPVRTIKLCSGKNLVLPEDEGAPDRPQSSGCHAQACIAGRAKSNGERR